MATRITRPTSTTRARPERQAASPSCTPANSSTQPLNFKEITMLNHLHPLQCRRPGPHPDRLCRAGPTRAGGNPPRRDRADHPDADHQQPACRRRRRARRPGRRGPRQPDRWRHRAVTWPWWPAPSAARSSATKCRRGTTSRSPAQQIIVRTNSGVLVAITQPAELPTCAWASVSTSRAAAKAPSSRRSNRRCARAPHEHFD